MGTNAIRIHSEELMPHIRAALVTATYAANEYFNPDAETIMLYQGKGDVGDGKLSIFSHDVSNVCATHSRVSMQNSALSLPSDKCSNGELRAYITISDVDKLCKWLKPMPRGIVNFYWNETDDGMRTLRLTLSPLKSSKTFDALDLTYADSPIDWGTRNFRTPFSQGRLAYRNAMSHCAVRQFSMFTLGPKAINWLDEVYDGRSIDIIPFDNGRKLYIRSDFCTTVEAVCELPYRALNNSQGKKEL